MFGEGPSSHLRVRFMGLTVCRSRSWSSSCVEVDFEEEVLDRRREGDRGVVGPLTLAKTERYDIAMIVLLLLL